MGAGHDTDELQEGLVGNAQFSGRLALPQHRCRRATLSGISWIAAIDQNISVDEGSHDLRKVLRASSRDSLESDERP